MAAIDYCSDGNIYLELSAEELAVAVKTDGNIAIDEGLAEELGNNGLAAAELSREARSE